MKDYIEIWVAVGGAAIIAYSGAYLVVYYHWPIWAAILTVIVFVHLAVGWVMLVRKWFD